MLTKLYSHALNKTDKRYDTEPTTALGKRLLNLSIAYDIGTLDDTQIDFFLDELIGVCEEQLEIFDSQGSYILDELDVPKTVCKFLQGICRLVECFDEFEHVQLSREVSRLEWEVTKIALSFVSAEIV